MCGRYAFVTMPIGRWKYVFKTWIDGNNDRYNIAPTANIPVFTPSGWQMMRWGLIPSWSKKPDSKYSTFNARAESLISKPAYRSAWKHGQRCLIPATGYFEWKKSEAAKQPYFIRSTQQEPLVFAGIWDKWSNGETELFSCSIITTKAEGKLQQLHHRMPIILEPEGANLWLHGSNEETEGILQTLTIPAVDYYAVDTSVGNARNQGNQLIQPLHHSVDASP